MTSHARTTPPERELTRTLRQRTRYLRLLTGDVRKFIAWMDVEMKKPSTLERGQRIAKALNALELSNDHARRFGLPSRAKKPRAKNAPVVTQADGSAGGEDTETGLHPKRAASV